MRDVLMPVTIVVLAVALLSLLAYTLRLVRLLHRYGTFQCALRRPGRRWHVGILLLGVDRLEWYPRRSFGLGPKYTFPRDDLEIGPAKRGRHPEVVIVQLRSGGEAFDAVLRTSQAAGLVSWVDSAPPAEEPWHF